MLTVGEKFPNFKLNAVISLERDNEFQEITESTHLGKWQVIFFWPMDFTFICPTEIAEFGKRNKDFVDRDAQVLGASTDTCNSPTGRFSTRRAMLHGKCASRFVFASKASKSFSDKNIRTKAAF